VKVGIPLVVFAVFVSAIALPAQAAPSPDATGIAVGRYNLLRSGVATDVGSITDPAIRWTFGTNGAIATSPLAADLDGDGGLEIFLSEWKPGPAADGSRLGYVLDAAGGLRYTVPLRFNAFAAAAADLDGDGRMELLFAEGSHSDVDGGIGYRAFNGEDGSPLWSFATPFYGGEGFFASPALADLDGDGRLDLIAGSMDHTVYALRGIDGSVLWRSPVLEHYIRHSTPIADFDGDGRLEVTVHTEAGIVHTFDAATGVEEWSVDLGNIVAATPAVGDLDGDGRLEIVYSLAYEGGVAALHGDGTSMWQNPRNDLAYRGPTLVDVDRDGRLDVVEGDSDDLSVSAYRGLDGAILWTQALSGMWASGPLVSADVDGDRGMEILVGSDLGLSSLDAATGAVEWTFALPRVRGEPLFQDIDGDGRAEILVGGGDGRLYALGNAAPRAVKTKALHGIATLKDQAMARGDWAFARSLEDAELHVLKSLGLAERTPLWLDDSHLDPVLGHKVFAQERQAVGKLIHPDVNGASDSVRCRLDPKKWTAAEQDALATACGAIASLLVEADEGLARTAIADAKARARTDTARADAVLRHIALAERAVAWAYSEWGSLEYGHAIDHFRQAWQHAQDAMRQTSRA